MNRAVDLARRPLGTAPRRHRATNAVRRAGTIDDGVGFRDARAGLVELAPITLQRMTGWTDVATCLAFPAKIGSTEGRPISL